MSTEKPLGLSDGLGCAAIILVVWFALGGGVLLVDLVFDRLERLEKVRQVQPDANTKH